MFALVLFALLGSAFFIFVLLLIGAAISDLYESYGWQAIILIVLWLAIAVCIFILGYPYVNVVLE